MNELQKCYERFFEIGGITIFIGSDLPIENNTFDKKFTHFAVDGPSDDTITISHHFGIPNIVINDLGKELYHNPPWAIYQYNNSYYYTGISTNIDDQSLHILAVCSDNHNHSEIYTNSAYEKSWRNGGLHSLTMFPTDQILIARLLADRQGCYLHSAGAIINRAGLLFVGHSEAGKSTTTNLLIQAAAKGNIELEILCDDRNIVRLMADRWQLYGSWSHGDVPIVSGSHAPLHGICFIEQAHDNTIFPLTDRNEIIRRLLGCLIRPFVTADWWKKTLDIIEKIMLQVPCYIMRFDKSGDIVKEILKIS